MQDSRSDLFVYHRHLSPWATISPFHQVLLSVWLLANHVSFRIVADKLDFTKSGAWTLLMDFSTTCAICANSLINGQATC